ncbi:MAG: hypothetical protein DHS20C18_22230 [Saprospiraceae bacterium]|nr:MAG: hypothetical protein DHS20C18_22230 [Saprospiraceae bacterium]
MLLSKKAVIELHYLPNIQFFSKLLLYPNIYLEQHENYRKGSYRNRAYIVGSNGRHRLSIPLQKGKNEQQNVCEVNIAYEEPWVNQHWQAIQSAYGNAPFFEFYVDAIQPLFENPGPKLLAFNQNLFNVLLRLIPIEVTIRYTEAYQHELPSKTTDLRDKILPKHLGKANDPYFKPVRYPQVFQEKHGFLANLSILDLLFCTGPQTIEYLEKSIIHP